VYKTPYLSLAGPTLEFPIIPPRCHIIGPSCELVFFVLCRPAVRSASASSCCCSHFMNSSNMGLPARRYLAVALTWRVSSITLTCPPSCCTSSTSSSFNSSYSLAFLFLLLLLLPLAYILFFKLHFLTTSEPSSS